VAHLGSDQHNSESVMVHTRKCLVANNCSRSWHGGGALAHRTRCTYYGKYISNSFENVKKIRQKILSVHLNNLCSPTKFCDKKIFFVTYIKNTENVHVNNNVGALKFVFFTEATKNILFSRNFMNEHKMSRCISSFFYKFSNILKYIFW
jgi:hypothetical protein